MELLLTPCMHIRTHACMQSQACAHSTGAEFVCHGSVEGSVRLSCELEPFLRRLPSACKGTGGKGWHRFLSLLRKELFHCEAREAQARPGRIVRVLGTLQLQCRHCQPLVLQILLGFLWAGHAPPLSPCNNSLANLVSRRDPGPPCEACEPGSPTLPLLTPASRAPLPRLASSQAPKSCLCPSLNRKNCLLGNNVLMMASAFLLGISKTARSFELLLVGRFLCGISAGEPWRLLLLLAAWPGGLRWHLSGGIASPKGANGHSLRLSTTKSWLTPAGLLQKQSKLARGWRNP